MKAIMVHELGNTDVLKFEECVEPVPKDDDVKIQIKAAGVNFIDIYNRTGVYKKNLPLIPGDEGSGIITEVGKNVRGFQKGDRVAYAMVTGSYAQYAVVPYTKIVKIPDKIDFNLAAACMLQGLTAQYLAKSTYPLKPNDRVLIHAAAGGVGHLLVQVAKLLGAYVIGTTSSEKKAQFIKQLGADAVINYSEKNFAEEVKKLTNNKGVNVVYDSVGKTSFMDSLNVLVPRGYLVLFGQSSGVVEPISPTILAKGSNFLTRPSLSHYILSPEELNQRSSELFNWLISGKVKLTMEKPFPLSEAKEAHKLLESRNSMGKIVLIP